jgi:hypothetical protein
MQHDTHTTHTRHTHDTHTTHAHDDTTRTLQGDKGVEHGVVEEAVEQRRGAKDPEPRDRDRGGQLHAIVAAAAAVVVLAGDQHGGGHVLFAVVLEQGREAGGEEHRERGL